MVDEVERTGGVLTGGKVVHHRCGYALWVEVLTDFGDLVVVTYRAAVNGIDALVVYHCPGCGKELKLWWKKATDEKSEPQGERP